MVLIFLIRRIQRVDDRASELPSRGECDRNNREKTYSDDKGRHDYSKHQNKSRKREDEDYRRRDKYDGERYIVMKSERHRRDGVSHRKR
jgi:peptidyl-prolyl cis-trans isomerase-like 4